MWNLTKNIFKVGIQTKNILQQTENVEVVGKQLAISINRHLGRALNIRMIDAGSCNGCELEINNINNPYYNIERFSVNFVASPRHADMLLITGPVTKNMREALLRAYEATPDPKLVVAIGDCAHCGGVFNSSDAVIGAVDKVVPVNVIVKGCPPTPMDIIQGILSALS